MCLVLLLAAVIGGAYWYFTVYKKNKNGDGNAE